MAHVSSRRQTPTSNADDEVQVIDIVPPPQSRTTSSTQSTRLTNAHAEPPTVAVETKKDAEIITIDDDDESSLNQNSLRRVSPVSGRKSSAAEEGSSTKIGHTSDETTLSTATMAHTSNLPQPPCKELKEDALWRMISAKARKLRLAGTNDWKSACEALILFRQMIAEVLTEFISNPAEPVDDVLGRHAAACHASTLRLGQLLRVSEHLKSLAQLCLTIKQAAAENPSGVDNDDEIMIMEPKQDNDSLLKRPQSRSDAGEPRLRDIGNPASSRLTIGKSHIAGGHSVPLSRETRATARSEQNSGISRLFLGIQTGPSFAARPYRATLKKDSTRAEFRASPKPSSPERSRSPVNSSAQHEDSVQNGTEDSMLTDGMEPQAQLRGRDSGTVAADHSDRVDGGLETSYAEERIDTSVQSSFEDSAIAGAGEDYECEEMVDADSVRIKHDACTEDRGKFKHHPMTGESPLQVPPLSEPPAATYLDEPTQMNTNDVDALKRGREGRSPMKKKAVVSPGRSRMPFSFTIRTKSSPPRHRTLFNEPDQPSTSADAYRESAPPMKKPRWSSAATPKSHNSKVKGLTSPRDKRASSSDLHISGPSTSSMATAKTYHLRNRRQLGKSKQATDTLENDDSQCGSSGRTAHAPHRELRRILKRGGFDGSIALKVAGNKDQGNEKRRVSWPIGEEPPGRYGSPWAKITAYRKILYHPDAPDTRTLDLPPPRRVFTEPFEFPTTSSYALQISVPNADGKRADPMQCPEAAERSQQIAQELLNEAADAFRAVTHAREIRHWIITDSLLKGLREDVLNGEKTLLTRFDLLCDSLEGADVNGGVEPGRTRVALSRVFIVLGFDVALFHSSEEDDFGAEMVTDEVQQKLLKWFVANVHKKEVCRVKDIFEGTDTYGNEIWSGMDITYHTSTPPIVLVTIPEVPDDEVLEKWKANNAHFRWFVKEWNEHNKPVEGRRLLELLDWAELCHNNPAVSRSYEGRVRLLFEEMNLRYGVLLQSNVVDDAPVNDGDGDDDDGDEA